MRCWVEEFCKKYPDGCDNMCIGYTLLKALYLQSNMPTIYQFPHNIQVVDGNRDALKKVQEYLDDVEENVRQGKGLYLWGYNTGTGKTLNACRILNTYFRKRAFDSNLECLGVFINVPTFLEQIRKSFDKKDFQEDVFENVMKADIVIFDDIGAEKPSEWVRERLYTIINHRVDMGLVNIFTSNLPIEKIDRASKSIEEILDSRIASRILGCTEQIELKGKDWRRGGGTDK